jgi:hypothetical protein
VHVPIVLVLHVALSLVAWPTLVKFGIVVTVTTLVCLATYQIMVRHTFVGLVLNGRRGESAREPVAAPAQAGAAIT